VNFKSFALKPTIALPLETEAYHWARLNSFVRTAADKTCYYMEPKDSAKSFPMSEVAEYEKQVRLLSLRKFDTYLKWKSRFVKVKMEGKDWENGRCSCETF